MLKNVLLTSLRNLARHKLYTLINLLGLATGLACFVLIGLYVRYQRSYDRFAPKAEQMYRVVGEIEMEGQGEHSSSMVFGLGPTLYHDHPELIERYCRWFDFQDPQHSLKVGDSLSTNKLFTESGLYLVDSTVFELFGYPLKVGDPKTALARPGSIVLSESLAKKYFGDADPMGQMMKWDGSMDVQVTGILGEIPRNSHIHFEGLASMGTILQYWKNIEKNNWVWNPCWTYVRLKDGISKAEVDRIFPGFIQKYYPDFLRDQIGHELQPLVDIHLTSKLDFEMHQNGDAGSVNILWVIGFFIILLASVNFMNLATARSAYRAREVGVRKSAGATRGQLIGQFLLESVLMSVIAALIALVLIQLVMPAFNELAGEVIVLPEMLVPGVLGLAVVVGLLSGVYPAFFLSSFQPAVVLKANAAGTSRGQALRKSLVVVQFAIAMVLIIGTVFVKKQHDHLRTVDLGFNKEQVLLIPVRGPMADVYTAVFPELKNISGVKAVSWANDIIGKKHNTHEFNWGTMEQGKWTYLPALYVNPEFNEVANIDLLAGRWFSREFPGDDSLSVIINETFAQQLHPDDPTKAIGDRMDTPHGEERVIGVAKDFAFDPLFKAVQPFVFDMCQPDDRGQWIRYLYLRLEAGDPAPVIAAAKEKWNARTTDFPFEYQFLDEQLDMQYEAQGRLAKLIGIFSLLAVFIACLGLFALASWTAEKRTREIGIRKVMGADTMRITYLVTRDFLLLVFLGALVAMPLAWFGVGRWLENFAFRTAIEPLVFVLAALVVLMIATFTVSFRAVRAAQTDPVRALRHE
ncbi:MAG: ABC transporter permease [Flavobacteriales bacterium]|nr:ABC transporter permease [Flavobacteriales bacterium]MBK9539681.1 ABC transporter permease [Flavobacteriales bacterium]